MTAVEYRAHLERMTPQQRTDLSAEIFLGGWRDVDRRVSAFEKYRGRVEPIAVLWISKNIHGSDVRTEEDRVAQANLDSADFAKRSYRISLWALYLAIASIVLAAIALIK